MLVHLLAPSVVAFLEGIPDTTGNVDEIVVLERPRAYSFEFFLKFCITNCYRRNFNFNAVHVDIFFDGRC